MEVRSFSFLSMFVFVYLGPLVCHFHLSVCVKITVVCSLMWLLSHFCPCLLPVCVSKSIGIDCCVFFGEFLVAFLLSLFCCHHVSVVPVFTGVLVWFL